MAYSFLLPDKYCIQLTLVIIESETLIFPYHADSVQKDASGMCQDAEGVDYGYSIKRFPKKFCTMI